MRTVVLGNPPDVLLSLISDRRRLGLDTHDEVWQGEYHMAPAANFQHGQVQLEIAILLRRHVPDGFVVGLQFNLGKNTNFRVPDLGVHRGEPHGSWFATAALVVEVRSPDDETYEKFDFYFEHGVEEILVTDLTTREVHWFLRSSAGFDNADRSELFDITTANVAAILGWPEPLAHSET
jgi:Uma2 family endonuclease